MGLLAAIAVARSTRPASMEDVDDARPLGAGGSGDREAAGVASTMELDAAGVDGVDVDLEMSTTARATEVLSLIHI